MAEQAIRWYEAAAAVAQRRYAEAKLPCWSAEQSSCAGNFRRIPGGMNRSWRCWRR